MVCSHYNMLLVFLTIFVGTEVEFLNYNVPNPDTNLDVNATPEVQQEEDIQIPSSTLTQAFPSKHTCVITLTIFTLIQQHGNGAILQQKNQTLFQLLIQSVWCVREAQMVSIVCKTVTEM